MAAVVGIKGQPVEIGGEPDQCRLGNYATLGALEMAKIALVEIISRTQADA